MIKCEWIDTEISDNINNYEAFLDLCEVNKFASERPTHITAIKLKPQLFTIIVNNNIRFQDIIIDITNFIFTYEVCDTKKTNHSIAMRNFETVSIRF